MNENILNKEVQDYINLNINADINKVALAKPLFKNVSSADLAGQIITKKKAFISYQPGLMQKIFIILLYYL